MPLAFAQPQNLTSRVDLSMPEDSAQISVTDLRALNKEGLLCFGIAMEKYRQFADGGHPLHESSPEFLLCSRFG